MKVTHHRHIKTIKSLPFVKDVAELEIVIGIEVLDRPNVNPVVRITAKKLKATVVLGHCSAGAQ